MYLNPPNTPEPHNPMSSQYPLRPAARTSPFRIDVFKSLRLHKVTALMVGLLVLGLGLAVVAKHKPTYVATSTVYVSPTPIRTLVDDRELDRPYDSYIAETVRAISRHDILVDAIRKMPPGTWQYPGEPERIAALRLEQSLNVSRVGTTYQVEISIEGPRPEHLADIVNAVADAYIEKAKSEQYYGRDDRLKSLKDEQTRIQTQTDALLQEQDQITKALGVASVNPKGASALDNDNATLQSDLLAAHQQRILIEANLAALNAGDPNAPNSALNAAADDIVATDPGLEVLKKSLSQRRADLVDKLANMTEANPQRKQAEDQLNQTDKAIQAMQTDLRRKAAAHLEEKLKTQLTQAQTVESRLNSDLQRGTRQAVDTAPKLQRAAEIQADLDRLQARLNEVDNRISNLELESSSPGSVHLFEPALTPLGPEKSKSNILLIAIFPIAVVLGVLAALLLDLFDPRVYTGADVEAILGFAPLGTLFDDREVTQIVFDECALRLAAGVDHAARQAGARTFVVTAVNSGAGTTSIIENLGSMLAKLGRKTLVIDPSGNSEPVAFVTLGADLEKHSVPFAEATGAETATTSEIQRSRLSNPSLTTRASAMNGLVFERFQTLSAEYDIVLIDAAPILISAETEYLARMADVTVIVAEAGKTKKAWITRAARLLERLGVAGAAAVINKVHPSRVEDALKHDLREFELRSDRVTMQEWWKPGKNSTRPASMNPAPFDSGHARKDEEDAVFAQDI